MTIRTGDKIPECELKIMGAEGPQSTTTQELFAGKKVVMFAVPGAFTPGCSMTHLPGFVVNADKIKAKGVDSIICVSVNDAFVMDAWGKAQNADELIMHDGCGLSRFNAITTNLFVDLLIMIKDKNYFNAFYNSLAVVGDENDISSYSNYGIGTLLEKNAHIKSGVIGGVRSYSGYLNDKNGRTIVFSMIANNFNGNGSAVSNIHKKIMIKLAEIE